MIKPLVSVIIPCYNAEKYVEQAVCSIMNQTYSNLEILCCDDCSEDNTLEILNKLASEDNRITVIHNEQNLKLIDTLNKLVSLSTGKYIARMDSDDICLPERIEKQVEFLEENMDVSFCGCNAYHINEQNRIIGKSNLPLTYEDNKFFLKYYSTFYHPTVMARAEVFKNNPYDKDFIHAEDYELWCRLFFEKKLKGSNLRKYLFMYRLNSQGVSQQNQKKQMESSARVFNKYPICENPILIKNVFFEHSISVSKTDFAELLKEKKQLSKHKFTFSFKAYSKLLFHLKKKNSFMDFIYYSINPLGIYTLARLVF